MSKYSTISFIVLVSMPIMLVYCYETQLTRQAQEFSTRDARRRNEINSLLEQVDKLARESTRLRKQLDDKGVPTKPYRCKKVNMDQQLMHEPCFRPRQNASSATGKSQLALGS